MGQIFFSVTCGWSAKIRVAIKIYYIPCGTKAMLGANFNKLEPISPGILGIEPAHAGKVVIIDDRRASTRQDFAKFIQTKNSERGMRFPGRIKIPFHADMHLL